MDTGPSNHIATMNIQVKGDVFVGCSVEKRQHEHFDARTEEKAEEAKKRKLEHGTENVPQQGIQAPVCTTEAGAASINVVPLSGQVNVQNSTVYIDSRSEDQGKCSLKPSPLVDINTLEFTGLKEYYLNTLCQAPPLPWYPEYSWDIDEFYTELALKNVAMSKFGLEALFTHAHEHFRKGSYRILIEGDAGYGKSTLMLKIASDWSRRDSNDPKNYTSPFKLVFVVKLGHVGEDGTVLSYMESVCYEKMNTKLKDVLESKLAEEVLILLDGYDEAKPSTMKEAGKIMEKDILSKCHVVLTSRFGRVPDSVRGKALLVTVKGFGRRQVTEAVCKFFIKAGHLTNADVVSCVVNYDQGIDDSTPASVDDFGNVKEISPLLPIEERLSPERFKQFLYKVLDESPCKELAQCPLLCVMLCCLVSECPNGELPSNCSGLYFAMINRNLYRAASKKARAAGEVVEEWNWSVLNNRIRTGHESYFQDFGRLCIDGLITKRMSFTIFEIVGDDEVALPTDVKVTQLIEAGVLVRDFTELDTSRGLHHQPQRNKKIARFQVPHRTTAEFLAAYYLSLPTDKYVAKLNRLLDLYRLSTSFDEISEFLLEMEKKKCLADAFSVVKFTSFCFRDKSFCLKSYLTQHGAVGTWSEFKLALPSQLCIEFTDLSGSKQKSCLGDVTVSSPKPTLNLLQLVGAFGKMTGNQNALRSLPAACNKDVPVSLIVRTVGKLGAVQFPYMLETVLKSRVVLNSFTYAHTGFTAKISDRIRQESARVLQALLKDNSCPVQLSFENIPDSLQLGVVEAMRAVPEACRLKRFAFFQALPVYDITTQLSKVLADKWLSHLQHLGLELEEWGSGGTGGTILKRLTEPECSLTSLHLRNYTRVFDQKGGPPLLEDLMMLASKLETIKLEGIDLYFDVSRTSKEAVQEKCTLKSLHLVKVSLTYNGLLPSADENKELLLAWRNVSLNLEELTIDDCTFPMELFNWLNLTAPNLRTVTIGAIYKKTHNYKEELYANQLLEALTQSSADCIEDLSLDRNFWETSDVLMLHPIREALQRCPRMKRVNLGISRLPDLLRASVGPGPSTRLSSGDVEALESNNVALALLEIVLSVPNLQTLTSRVFFDYSEELGTFHALANKAHKWQGKGKDSERNTLTLCDLSNRNACNAIHVFRERRLEYCLSYVSHRAYELCFPVLE